MNSQPTYWYPAGTLRKRIGIITWLFALGYVELTDMETGETVLRLFDELEKTK